MKIIFNLVALFFVATTAQSQNQLPGKPIGDPAKILKDGVSFLYYNRDYLRTTQDLKAYNAVGKAISKTEFFKAFASGNYLPMRLSPNSGNYYQLYKLGPKVPDDVRSTIKQYGTTANQHFKQEGRKFPGLNYKDVTGKVYNSQNTK